MPNCVIFPKLVFFGHGQCESQIIFIVCLSNILCSEIDLECHKQVFDSTDFFPCFGCRQSEYLFVDRMDTIFSTQVPFAANLPSAATLVPATGTPLPEAYLPLPPSEEAAAALATLSDLPSLCLEATTSLRSCAPILAMSSTDVFHANLVGQRHPSALMSNFTAHVLQVVSRGFGRLFAFLHKSVQLRGPGSWHHGCGFCWHVQLQG